MIEETKSFLKNTKSLAIKIGDKFTLSGDIGKFIKGEEIEVTDIKESGDDLELIFSNGKDQDNFFIDKDDNFDELT